MSSDVRRLASGSGSTTSGSGNDSNNGSFASPFRTLTHARGVLAAGDTVYAMNGSDLSSNDGGGWHAAFTLGTDLMPAGTAANPIAFVVYPANSVTIGSTTGADVQYGIRTKASGNHYVVFSGFVLTDAGTSGAIEVNDNGWRIVNNTITCPKSNGATGCIFLNGGTSGHYVYGNDVSQSGKLVTSSKLFHQIYVQSNSTWVGWNQVHDNFTCRGIQFHNSSGPNEFDLHVFNNLIYNDPCDGINFATVDPSKGTVEAFNNVIYHVGAGPDPADGAANSACIYSADITNAGSPGSGAIKIYNNTMYDCGSHSPFSGSAGAIVKNGSASSLTINATGNIFQQLSGEGYINGATGQISGDRNIWFGSGSGPTSGFTNNINSNPLLANVPTRDFHVLLGSPAIGAAAASPVPARDYDGNVRPAPASVGAFELSGTGSVSRPNPPTNLTIVVG